MTRLMVTLENTEAEALAQLAYAELRDPRDQLRLILRQELARRGLLEPLATPGQEERMQNAEPTQNL